MHPRDWLHRRSLPVDRPTGPPNPFEACLLVACAVIGIATAAGFARPLAFQDVLPPWARLIWGGLMFVGGIAAVAGLYWPGDPVDGVLIKRGGLVTLAPLALAYGLAGFADMPSGRFVASTFAIALSIACVLRVRQVSAAIKGLHSQLRGLRQEWENGDDP
jgi:hypothetical protein